MKGNPVPLPEWFRKGSVCKLTSPSMLVNFVSYMHEVAENVSKSILSELYKLSIYKPQGRPIYSNEIIFDFLNCLNLKSGGSDIRINITVGKL